MKQAKSSNQLNHILYIMVSITLGGTILSAFALSSTHATTGTASDANYSNASVTVPDACSMTASVNTEHTAIVPNGVWSGNDNYYPSGIGKTTISTFCNDASGYSIYAVGYTGGSMTGNNTVLSSSQLGSEYDIATGTAKNGNTSNWAMKVTKVTDSSTSYLPENLTIQNGYDNANYHTVPSTYEEVARYSTATDATLGSKLETTYAAYISITQPAGTYTGKVKYTLVHPGGTEAPEIDTMQNVAYWGGSLQVGDEVTVTDSRDGQEYTVARLCTNYDGDNCTSSQIWMTQNLNFQIGGNDANGDPIVMDSRNTDLNSAYDSNNNLLADYSVSGSIITWSPTVVSTTAPDEATNNTIARAVDGPSTPATISDFAYSGSATTVVSNWKNQDYYPYQAEGTLNGEEVYEFATGGTYDTIITGGLQACIDAGHTAAECKHYQVGNYYNFSAVNAMSNSTQYTDQYTVMDNSICPKGWRLPKGLTSDGTTVTESEFNTLLKAQGVTNGTDLTGGANTSYASGGFTKLQTTGLHGDPLYFARSGLVNGTAMHYSSSYGYYWSSTVATPGTYGYLLHFNSSYIYPAYQGSRYYGRSARCLAR